MSILERIVMNKEVELIMNMVSEQGLIGRKIYFDDLFYYTDEYVKREIEWVLVENVYSTDSVYYGIEGESFNNRFIDIQVIPLVYHKLQKYIREFEEENK